MELYTGGGRGMGGVDRRSGWRMQGSSADFRGLGAGMPLVVVGVRRLLRVFKIDVFDQSLVIIFGLFKKILLQFHI